MPLVQRGSARQMASNGTGAGAGAPPCLAARVECSEISNKRVFSLASAVGRSVPRGAASPAACLRSRSEIRGQKSEIRGERL